MAVAFSTTIFPNNAGVKNKSGLPWGAVIQPLGHGTRFATGPPAHEVARCDKCFSYLHQPRIDISQRWLCQFCGHRNGLPVRYKSSGTTPQVVELRESAYECDVVEPDESLPKANKLMYLIAIGLADQHTHLAALKLGLQAAIEAMPPSAEVAMVSFSTGKVCVYDLASQDRVHVREILVPASLSSALSNLDVLLDDICPLAELAVPVHACKNALAVAIDSLSEQTEGVRGQALDDEMLLTSLNVILDWISGINEAAGVLVDLHLFWTGGAAGSSAVTPAKLATYDAAAVELATRAAMLSTSISGFTFLDSPSNLSALKHLFVNTGGSLLAYSPESLNQLPQDVHRHISTPRGYQCMLRLRTSFGFRVARAYGAMYPDSEHAGLFRMTACSVHTNVALDFEFEDTVTFDENILMQPNSSNFLQLAFSYVIPVPKALFEESHSDSDDNIVEFKLVRKLRILTINMTNSGSARELHRNVDPAVVLSLLTYKIARASQTRGLVEARMLLQDWLCVFLAKFNEARMDDSTTSIGPNKAPVDVHLSNHPSLQLLMRYVYGLLRSPMLDPSKPANARAVYEALYSALSPAALVLAVYPRLLTYDSFDSKPKGVLRLSRQAIVQSASPVLLLDAFSHLLVYINFTASDLSARPSKDSAIWTYVNTLRSDRPIVPTVQVVQAGTSDASLLDPYLYDDHPQGAASADGGISSANWEDFVQQMAALVEKELALTSGGSTASAPAAAAAGSTSSSI